MEQAQAELNKFKTKIGKDQYGRNYREDEDIHSINAPCGEQVILLSKVSSAGLIDSKMSYELAKDIDDLNIERKSKYKEAGQEPVESRPPTDHE